jgi:shikimate dehydrogenase
MTRERVRTRVRGSTHVVGVIGWPVSGSLSPVIHNTAFITLGLDWVYVPLAVPPGRVAPALAGLAALGFSGANVTMPHKTECAELIDDLSEDAERLRAVNTIVVAEGELTGLNTDAPGFDRFLRRDAGYDAAGQEALVYGAGGAARAVALALARGGLRRLWVAVRDRARAEGVVRTLDGIPTQISVVRLHDAKDLDVSLVVNATPIGAGGESLPTPPLDERVLVVDLLYRPRMTPLQAEAKRSGAPAFGGLGLLLHQAALSFELWTGQPPPLSEMSASAIAALADAEDEPVA